MTDRPLLFNGPSEIARYTRGEFKDEDPVKVTTEPTKSSNIRPHGESRNPSVDAKMDVEYDPKGGKKRRRRQTRSKISKKSKKKTRRVKRSSY